MYFSTRSNLEVSQTTSNTGQCDVLQTPTSVLTPIGVYPEARMRKMISTQVEAKHENVCRTILLTVPLCDKQIGTCEVRNTQTVKKGPNRDQVPKIGTLWSQCCPPPNVISDF